MCPVMILRGRLWAKTDEFAFHDGFRKLVGFVSALGVLR